MKLVIHPQQCTAVDNIKNATSTLTSIKNITSARQPNDNLLAVEKKNKETSMQSNIPALRQSAILILAHQIIPPKDFIPLYDSSLDKIADAHVTAKIPCNGNSSSTLELIIGHTPDFKPVKLEPVKELSKPDTYARIMQVLDQHTIVVVVMTE